MKSDIFPICYMIFVLYVTLNMLKTYLCEGKEILFLKTEYFFLKINKRKIQM